MQTSSSAFESFNFNLENLNKAKITPKYFNMPWWNFVFFFLRNCQKQPNI